MYTVVTGIEQGIQGVNILLGILTRPRTYRDNLQEFCTVHKKKEG